MFDAAQNAIHDAAAAGRFPGADYYQVLAWLHEDLQPASYVEIGVSCGESLKLARPPTIALGIDPAPQADHRWRAPTRVVALTSSEFFAACRLRDFLGADRFSFAFIDGLHRFEQAIADLFQLERFAGPESVVALHDTIPLNEQTASRERTTLFHTGDVWKAVPFLLRRRPDLDLITVRTAPSGLTLICGLDPRRASSPAPLGEFAALPFAWYEAHQGEFLKTMPNEREALRAWLAGRKHL